MVEKKKYRNNQYIYRIIGIIILIIIVYKIDKWHLLNIAKQANIKYLLIGCCLTFVHNILKAFRWRSLMRIQRIDITIFETWQMYMAGIYVGIITPGRVGDLVRVFFLKNMYPRFSYGKVAANVIVDRLSDILIILFITIVGGFFYIKEEPRVLQIVLLSFFFLFITILMWRRFRKTNYRIYLNKVFFERLKLKIDCGLDSFKNNLKTFYSARTLGFPLFFLLISYIVFFIQLYLIAMSIEIDIPFSFLTFSMSVAMLFSLLPISIAGIGIRDALLIYFFSKAGIIAESAIVFSTAYLMIVIVGSALIGFFAYFSQNIEKKIPNSN